jgi:hypothetical protein
MSEWDFPYIFNYWDQLTGAITKGAMRMHELSPPEQVEACDEIRQAMRRHVQALSDLQLMELAVSLVDDLYKYVNDEVYYAQALLQYLDAFGRTFTTSLRQRGYVLQYVVDNTFLPDFLMVGAFDIFPMVFNAIGLVYVCPQQIAWKLMEHDGVPASGYAENIGRYNMEARVVAARLVNRCLDGSDHYLFLDADYEEGALDLALRDRAKPGVLSAFRNEAPIPDSKVNVDLRPKS